MALPFGRFKWTRLPMGTVIAQDIFQSKLDVIFIDMEGVTGIADDMVIAGRDEMEHDRNFLAFMEKCISKNLTLNSEKIQFRQSQASFYGQKGKVICYTSIALTKTEQNYQNLEREALGTIWGMEKFYYFLYGKEFTLKTNQKPLVSIYKKHIIDISPRVQRLIVRSFPYLPFKVVYKKGADIPVADALSRVAPMDPEDNIKLPIIAVNMITTLILMSTDCHSSFSNKLE